MEDLNNMAFIGENKNIQNHCLYSNAETFNPKDGFKGEGWVKLKNYVMKQASKLRYLLFSNGRSIKSINDNETL